MSRKNTSNKRYLEVGPDIGLVANQIVKINKPEFVSFLEPNRSVRAELLESVALVESKEVVALKKPALTICPDIPRVFLAVKLVFSVSKGLYTSKIKVAVTVALFVNPTLFHIVCPVKPSALKEAL